MATFLISPNSSGVLGLSGVNAAVVNAADETAALARARALPGYASSIDASFSPPQAWAVTQLASEDSAHEFLIEGRPLLPGTRRRAGQVVPS